MRLLVVIVVCLAGVGGVYAGEPSDTDVAVTAAAHKYLEAFAVRDVKGCVAAFVPGKKAVMMGTGPGERWIGSKEIAEAHTEMLKAFEKEEFEAKWRSVNSAGKVAWTASEVKVTDIVEGKKNEFVIHLSVVWVLRKDKWLIALMHYSNLTGPESEVGSP
jgi:hypothetical protein